MSEEEQVKIVTPEPDENEKNQKTEHVFVEPEVPPKKIELMEEAKLRSKYPALNRPGSSGFLQKRLSKGQKYFDSGDYNMAKAKGQKKIGAQDKLVPDLETTGDTIPTPEDLHSRKTSLTASKLAAGSLRPLGGGAIPTPESLHRKPVYAQSKLAADMS